MADEKDKDEEVASESEQGTGTEPTGSESVPDQGETTGTVEESDGLSF